MDKHRVEHIAHRLMGNAAVPFREQSVADEVMAICREAGLSCESDAFGNLVAVFKRGNRVRPLVMVSHMDHPGFEIVERLARGRWRARFLGGVGKHYFKRGTPLRLFPGDTHGMLGQLFPKTKCFEIIAIDKVDQSPSFAVWDLENFRIQGTRIRGLACDDLIGLSVILAALIRLQSSSLRGYAIGLITRAEEVGFQGALAAASCGSVPKNSIVVSLETSKEMPPIAMGRGVVIRVGDRTSIFDSAATRFLSCAAEELGMEDKSFRFQRALMSGGSCEATAFQGFGYTVAAACVVLGNYHNCGPRKRVAAEFVHRKDVKNMVALMIRSIQRMGQFERFVEKLPLKLKAMSIAAKSQLMRSRG